MRKIISDGIEASTRISQARFQIIKVLCFNTPLKIRLRNLWIFKAFLERLHKPVIRLNNLKTSLRFPCLDLNPIARFQIIKVLCFNTPLKIRLRNLWIFKAFLERLHKPVIRLNNLKTSLRVPCLDLNPIARFQIIKVLCFNTPLKIRLRNLWIFKAFLERLHKPVIRLNNLKTSLRFPCLDLNPIARFQIIKVLCFNTPLKIRLRNLWIFKAFLERLHKPVIRLNNLKTSLRFPCLDLNPIARFQIIKVLCFNTPLKIRLRNLWIFKAFLERLHKPLIRLNNLKTSLRFPCLDLNPIARFQIIKVLCFNTPLKIRLRNLWIFKAFLERLHKPLIRLNNLKTSLRVPCLDLNPIARFQIIKVLCFNTPLKIPLRNLWIFKAFLERLHKPVIRLNNLKTSLRFPCLDLNPIARFQIIKVLCFNTPLKIQLRSLWIFKAFLERLHKPLIRLNNLKTSLRFPCLDLNPIARFQIIKVLCSNTPLNIRLRNLWIFKAFLERLNKPLLRLNNLKSSLRFPCLDLNPIIDSIYLYIHVLDVSA